MNAVQAAEYDKIHAEFLSLKEELYTSVMRKIPLAKEINVPEHMKKIQELKTLLEKF